MTLHILLECSFGVAQYGGLVGIPELTLEFLFFSTMVGIHPLVYQYCGFYLLEVFFFFYNGGYSSVGVPILWHLGSAFSFLLLILFFFLILISLSSIIIIIVAIIVILFVFLYHRNHHHHHYDSKVGTQIGHPLMTQKESH